MIVIVTIMTSVATIVTFEMSGGIILLIAIINFTVCGFGATLLSLHNSLAKLNGQKIFFL
jgi:hypothetical protein